ncbi:hypothetical protein ES703_112246 [subsurface metagenome]
MKRRKRNRFLIWLPLLAALFIFSNIGEAQAYTADIIFDGIQKATGGNKVVTVEWKQASNADSHDLNDPTSPGTPTWNWYYLGYNIYCSPTSSVSPFDLSQAKRIEPEQGSADKDWSSTIDHFLTPQTSG